MTTTTNRSAPASTVVPILVYEDVNAAIDWLCGAFGFTERLRVWASVSSCTSGSTSAIATTSTRNSSARKSSNRRRTSRSANVSTPPKISKANYAARLPMHHSFFAVRMKICPSEIAGELSV